MPSVFSWLNDQMPMDFLFDGWVTPAWPQDPEAHLSASHHDVTTHFHFLRGRQDHHLHQVGMWRVLNMEKEW